jgi:hypothetical protein
MSDEDTSNPQRSTVAFDRPAAKLDKAELQAKT